MKEAIKNALQKALNLFGYQLSQIRRDAFTQQRLLLRSVQQPLAPVIFDLGANVGRVTRTYLELMPNARIYAFEPFPDSFERLRTSVAGNNSVRTYNLAVTDRKGRRSFSSNSEPATNSLLESDPVADAYWGAGRLNTTQRIEVDCVTLAEFCRDSSIDKIDILKMDIQGGEYMALLGAEDLLARQAISIIYTEIFTSPSYKEQKKLHEYLELLDRFGYDLFNVYDTRVNNGQLLQFDGIFISRAFRKELSISTEAWGSSGDQQRSQGTG